MSLTGLEEVKAISFDADGTLWDFEQVMRHALGDALGELCHFLRMAPAGGWSGRAAATEVPG